ncbi:hypothetical protein ABZ897_03470 [Nonomuraea sp. NPDC046802]|uniref:hypothetical protein n=1 Tax=Nonomuraea sp. NPDC046802 TaxID=3154919 RepID=UPI0033DEC0B9
MAYSITAYWPACDRPSPQSTPPWVGSVVCTTPQSGNRERDPGTLRSHDLRHTFGYLLLKVSGRNRAELKRPSITSKIVTCACGTNESRLATAAYPGLDGLQVEDQRFELLQGTDAGLGGNACLGQFLHPLCRSYKRALRFQPNRVATMAQVSQIHHSLIVNCSEYDIAICGLARSLPCDGKSVR